MSSTADSIQQRFLRFALAQGVLRFGTFTTKAGRASPYFFNAGLFHHGAALAALADFYAEAFLLAQAEGRLQADRLFG
ncbi:MAG: orotate phosphoribosyltransferase, partial [Burkholderiaceae bacterium]